jgi:hypothetical protein
MEYVDITHQLSIISKTSNFLPNVFNVCTMLIYSNNIVQKSVETIELNVFWIKHERQKSHVLHRVSKLHRKQRKRCEISDFISIVPYIT